MTDADPVAARANQYGSWPKYVGGPSSVDV